MHTGDWQDWEGAAWDILESTGCDDGPVDAVELADLCGFRVKNGRGLLTYLDRAERTIVVGAKQPTRRFHQLVCHELGHWSLERAGIADSEEGASYVELALLLPLTWMRRCLRESRSLESLANANPNATQAAIVERVIQLDWSRLRRSIEAA